MTTTVGITSYNHEAFIAECIESALAANPTEVIVVDDCSTDRTAEIADSYPVAVIRHEVNSGSGIAGLNRLLDEAGTDRLFWLSGDDAMEPCAVSETEAVDADWVFGDLTVVDGDGRPVTAWNYGNVPLSAARILAGMVETDARGLWTGLPIPTLASYRLSWLRTSPRPHDFDGWRQFGDTPTAIAWLKTNPRLWRVPRPLVRYRRHAGGETFAAMELRPELNRRIVEEITGVPHDGHEVRPQESWGL